MYSRQFDPTIHLFKVLAHPRRLQIIYSLKNQEQCVSDICKMLDLPQANASQHLMILRGAGIVISRRTGKRVVYKLAHPKIIEETDLLREMVIQK